ncbi:hypothetical protein [Marmoricola sp. RAF53]|uniref:hypothetical protein n=1 Tax=Marmoricola sp. RAF53 TaxID=3233059 RepID=UPI003F9A781D
MTGRVGRVVAWAGVAVLLAAVAALGAWWLQGGRWVRVETASMGTRAPVGSLLWVAPTPFSELERGDLITFTPPGHTTTYSHLVDRIEPDGTLATRGRITSPDPWRLRAADVHGRVVMTWKGVGWILLAAPVLLLGALLVAAVASRFRDRSVRLPVTLVGAALVVSAALVVYRPLVRADQLAFVPVDGGARATYVSTGLLPLRVSTGSGDAVVLRDGEVGSVVARAPERTAPQPGERSRFQVSLEPSVPFSWWAGLVGACFLPALLPALRRRPTAVRRAAHRAAAAA